LRIFDISSNLLRRILLLDSRTVLVPAPQLVDCKVSSDLTRLLLELEKNPMILESVQKVQVRATKRKKKDSNFYLEVEDF
jgi:hypothetical protein